MSETNTFLLRLTSENVERDLLPGDLFTEDPDFGRVRSVRLTRDGQNNAMVYTDKGDRDVLGLPSWVEITRITS